MKMLNNVVLMGRLSAAPELKTTSNGKNVVRFRLAVQRDYKDESGEYITDWISCVAWQNTADFIAKYFNKGQMIAVKGSIQTRSYEDKNGNKCSVTEVIADNVSFCGSKSDNAAASSPVSEPDIPIDTNDDDLPF